MKQCSDMFVIEYQDLKLDFELFTRDYIEKELEKDKALIVKKIHIPDERGRFSELKKYKKDSISSYYFAYIKFFVSEKKEYGIVGGKTNYSYPDVDFSTKSDTTARSFIRGRYEWSRDILVINYKLKDDEVKTEDKIIEDKKIKYLEKYIQRKFNLLDS